MRFLYKVIIINAVVLTIVESNCFNNEPEISILFHGIDYNSDNIPHFYQPYADKTSFGKLEYFENSSLDFDVLGALQDELYSVILMEVNTYLRYEQNGYTRLKWFVSNISGNNMKKGKKYWQGRTLAGFEPMKRHPGKYQMTILWIYKHIDNKTVIDDFIKDKDRDYFPFVNYYDYLCSRPRIEVIFHEENDLQAILEEMRSSKKRLE